MNTTKPKWYLLYFLFCVRVAAAECLTLYSSCVCVCTCTVFIPDTLAEVRWESKAWPVYLTALSGDTSFDTAPQLDWLLHNGNKRFLLRLLSQSQTNKQLGGEGGEILSGNTGFHKGGSCVEYNTTGGGGVMQAFAFVVVHLKEAAARLVTHSVWLHLVAWCTNLSGCGRWRRFKFQTAGGLCLSYTPIHYTWQFLALPSKAVRACVCPPPPLLLLMISGRGG